MQIGDIIAAGHDSERGAGIIAAVFDERAFVRLTIQSG